jgi:cation transport ATPase
MSKNKVLLEIVWWLITAVVVSVIMYPIWSDFMSFKFNLTNTVLVTCFVTFTRYAFLLKHTFLAHWEKGKIIFILCAIAFIGVLSIQVQDFNVWYDNGNPDVLLKVVKENKREGLLEYIKTEFIFFAVASSISVLFLAGRLLHSIWRVKNRGIV